ncbi:hypothetical protein ES703_44226 [subsurface metagenome]
MSFKERAARYFLLRKGVRQITNEIEKAGLDNLKALVDADKSIVYIYLQGCSASEQARIRRDLNTLLTMGITPDMLIDEVTRQLGGLAAIIKDKPQYKKAEVNKVISFLREG